MITKTTIVPRHPPPHLAAPAPAIMVLKKEFMIFDFSTDEITISRFGGERSFEL